MADLFISDLHLEADRPDIGAQFESFLEAEASHADALYILGDLFESWVGDDDPNPHYARMKAALRELTDRGVAVYFMHGNRDFMIGEKFADETGVTILPDPYVIEMHGSQVLLSHGDALCTDDVEFQALRRITSNPEWQAMMLSKPLDERLELATDARARSRTRTTTLASEIMDVNQDAVKSTIIEHGVDVLLHGHTHRPAVHDVDLRERTATRIVLGDWYEQGSVLRWAPGGFSLDVLARS